MRFTLSKGLMLNCFRAASVLKMFVWLMTVHSSRAFKDIWRVWDQLHSPVVSHLPDSRRSRQTLSHSVTRLFSRLAPERQMVCRLTGVCCSWLAAKWLWVIRAHKVKHSHFSWPEPPTKQRRWFLDALLPVKHIRRSKHALIYEKLLQEFKIACVFVSFYYSKRLHSWSSPWIKMAEMDHDQANFLPRKEKQLKRTKILRKMFFFLQCVPHTHSHKLFSYLVFFFCFPVQILIKSR